jgi:hypothetical protein
MFRTILLLEGGGEVNLVSRPVVNRLRLEIWGSVLGTGRNFLPSKNICTGSETDPGFPFSTYQQFFLGGKRALVRS